MSFYRTGTALTAWIGFALLAVVPAVAASPKGDFAALAQAAKGHFKPVGQPELTRAMVRVRGAAERLAARLTTADAEAANWKAFLGFDALQAELGKPKPDLAILEKAYGKLASGNEGLNLVWFAELRQALQSYLAAVQAMSDPNTPKRYEAIVEGLAKRLAGLAKGVSSEDAAWTAGALRWLDDTGQAPQLVAAVRHRHHRSNALASVSEGLAGVGIQRPIDEITPVRDCILGTDVHGSGHMLGQVSAKLVPYAHAAVLDTYFDAAVDSQSVGYHGPAIIHSVGRTQLQGIKRLWIDEEGIKAHPATSDADTCTTITCIQSTKGSALVERIASRRAAEQKSQAEAIASQHAEWRVNERMDRESADNIDQANDRYATRFRDPLVERNLFPLDIRYWTTDKWLGMRALEADAYHLGAPSAPPAAVQGDLTMRVHQSALNNLADKALGGMTVRDETFQATLKDVLGHVPEEFKPDQQDQPWAINFAPDVPITCDFLDNQFRISVRGRRYVRGDNAYPAMNVTVVYNIVRAGDTIKAVRQGGLQIFPPDFVPGKGERLSGRQLVIRDLLARRFGKVFKEELVGKGIELPGNWKKAGRLMPVAMTAKDGWLTVSWNRVPQSPAPTKTAKR